MLATRIIPVLLTRGRTLVKGVAFESWRSVGVAMQACRIHSMRGVDELVLLDISATPEHRGPDLALVEELSETMFMPLAVGGGIRTVADVRALLGAGADKVVVCTGALDRPHLVKEIADAVGSQALVVAIDYKRMRDPITNTMEPRVCSDCGTSLIVFQRDTGTPPIPDPLTWAGLVADLGAGEIMLTSIEREGKMTGYDLEVLERVAKTVPIPVVAHSGAGTYDHMREAIQAGASGVAAGSMFQFTDQTPRGAAEYLAKHGVEVRLK